MSTTKSPQPSSGACKPLNRADAEALGDSEALPDDWLATHALGGQSGGWSGGSLGGSNDVSSVSSNVVE